MRVAKPALPCPAAKATHSKVTGWADNKFEKLLQPKPGLSTVHGSNRSRRLLTQKNERQKTGIHEAKLKILGWVLL